MQGAGGVGGLLAIHDHIENKTFAPAYDGNGNVIALIDAATGTTAATYEYDPFGNLLLQEGAYALINPFRFSTKYTDNESGLLYYGHRYYNSEIGRWLSRDPIEEQGGVNMYAFAQNDGVNRWDYLGLATKYKCCTKEEESIVRKFELLIMGVVADAISIIQNDFSETGIYANFDYIREHVSLRHGRSLILRQWHHEIVLNLKETKNGLLGNRYGIVCERKQKGDRIAEAPRGTSDFGGNNIHLFPSFFKAGSIIRGIGMLHEASHLFARTKDNETGNRWDELHLISNDAYFIGELYPSPLSRLNALFKTIDRDFRNRK